MNNDKYLIAGLGNPGTKYVDTRHNVGFEMLDTIASYFDIKVKKVKNKGLVGEGKIAGKNVILVKPQTFMNLSGECISEVQKYYKIPEENVIIIYDDISLGTGRIRIRPKGSAGGHNGMKSIICHMNTENFPRIKIGIGSPDIPLADYVLQKFSKDEIKELTEVAVKMPELISVFIKDGINSAMNKFNS